MVYADKNIGNQSPMKDKLTPYFCECGHLIGSHYLNRGRCDENVPIFGSISTQIMKEKFGNDGTFKPHFVSCSCSRYKRKHA